MDKYSHVWVIASARSAILELTNGAATMGDTVSLLLAGDRENALNADTVYYYGQTGATQSFLSYIPAMVELIKEHRPSLILSDLSKNGRIAAAYAAAALGTNVMTDVTEIWVEDGKVTSKRMVYGGSAFKTEQAKDVAVLCVGAGVFEAKEPTPAGEIIDIPDAAAPGIVLKEKRDKVTQSVNLGAAKRVISVGRGLGSEEKLVYIQNFADAIDAEIGCSRPVAEEEKWLPKERYIGVSGCMIKPEVYVAAGISGQVQHMVGINQSGTIIAINKDKSAPIFSQCDYGIVGDLVTVLSELEKKFRG